MEIVQLSDNHHEIVKPLFLNEKYMGTDLNNFIGNSISTVDHYENFINTYLTGSKNFLAFGAFINHNLVAMACSYHNNEEPSWFGTQIRSLSNRDALIKLGDTLIDYHESHGRYKFYHLRNKKYLRSLRRFAYSEKNKERYDFFFEYTVPARHKCYYYNHWQILFGRTLLPIDVVVTCSFLKQKYRTTLSCGGGL